MFRLSDVQIRQHRLQENATANPLPDLEAAHLDHRRRQLLPLLRHDPSHGDLDGKQLLSRRVVTIVLVFFV